MGEDLKLPPPDREGEVDGWRSRIWRRGAASMRLRSQGSNGELNEYEGAQSVRSVKGSLEFCLIMAKGWFERNTAPTPTRLDL